MTANTRAVASVARVTIQVLSSGWDGRPFGHNRHEPKNWGTATLWGGLGPHPTQCGRDRGLPPCQVWSWSIQPFGHNTPTLQTG